MELIVDELGSVTNVAMKGRLDAKGAESADLPLSVLAGSKSAIIVDLTEVDFLASLGIRVLVTAAKAVQRKGGKLVIVVPGGNVRMVLDTAGLDSLIPMFPDRAAAVAAFS